MVNAKMFKGLKVRGTGRTSRNIRVAVWGAVFGKTSTIYVARQILREHILYGIKAECEANYLDYDEVMKFIKVMIPRVEGVRSDMTFVDNSFETAYYEER